MNRTRWQDMTVKAREDWLTERMPAGFEALIPVMARTPWDLMTPLATGLILDMAS